MRIISKLNKIAKNRFAPFVTFDDHGTFQPEWTAKAARAWLPYCSAHAVVFNKVTRREIASRSTFVGAIVQL